MHIYPWQIDSQSPEHRCLEYCYTKLGTSQCRSIYIYRQCTYTHGRLTPQSLEHRCLEYCYTKLGTSHCRSIYIDNAHIPMADWPPCQSSINALNTTTPNLVDLDIYRAMHIYLWHINPLVTKHRCLEYHYTKLGRSIYIEQCIYTHGRLTLLAIKHRCLEYCYT